MLGHYSEFDKEGQHLFIAEMINNCPSHMLAREYVKNAIECGATQIEWGVEVIDGVPKLFIKDNGSGMDLETFKKLPNMAVVTGKNKGKHGNKGIGAKISALHSHPGGVVYKTATPEDGVLMLKMWMEDGRLVYSSPELIQKPSDSIRPYTKVTFLGRSTSHDTVKQPWKRSSTTVPVARAIAQRFFRLPDGVVVSANNLSKEPVTNVPSIFEAYKRIARKHVAIKKDGLIIHYFHLKKRMDGKLKEGEASSVRHGAANVMQFLSAIVYKDETYDVHYGASWRNESIYYDLVHVADEVVVFVEIDDLDKYEVSSETNRVELAWDNPPIGSSDTSHRSKVRLKDFSDEVIANKPKWLKELISSKHSEAVSNWDNEARKRLKELMTSLIFQKLEPNSTGGTNVPTEPNPAGSSGDTSDGNEDSTKPTAPTARKSVDAKMPRNQINSYIDNFESEIITADMPHEVKLYDVIFVTGRDKSKVLLNGHHQYFEDAINSLVNGAGISIKDAKQLIFEQARSIALYQMGTFYVHGLLKVNSGAWDREVFKDSLSKPASSNFMASMREPLLKLSERLIKIHKRNQLN